MLTLIIPKPLLTFIDSNRCNMSRATYILKCVNYIMINSITLNNEGENNDRSENSKQRGKNSPDDKV